MAYDPPVVHPDFHPPQMIPVVDYADHVWPAIIYRNEMEALKQVIPDGRLPMLGIDAAIPVYLSDRFQAILEIVTETPHVRMFLANISVCYFSILWSHDCVM